MSKATRKSRVSVVVVTRNRKEELKACMRSILGSENSPFEIIVVDSGSEIPVSTWLKKKFPKVKIIRSDENVGAAAGRNLGIKASGGDYIFFMDDDATIDKFTMGLLLKVFRENKKTGIVQPLVYDMQKRNYVQGAGHTINLLTGRARAWGLMEKDRGQYGFLREIPMTGGICLIKREVFRKIGLFDEDYFIPYEDSDLCIRATKAGYKVFCSGEAKSWHQGKKATAVDVKLEWMGIITPERAYRIARNKMIFMRKHAPLGNFLIFLFVVLPVYVLVQSAVIILSKRADVLINYWNGFLSGLAYMVAYKD